MKAILVCILALLTFSPAALSQSAEKQSDRQRKADITSSDKSDEQIETDQVLISDKNSKSSEARTFTLDASDAKADEVTEEVEQWPKQEHEAERVDSITEAKTTDEAKVLAGKNSHHGGFGAITFRGSEFNNKDIILAGLRGGWIIDRSLTIGLEGFGIVPTAKYEHVDPANSVGTRLVGGYGGLFLEPILHSNEVIHVTFPVSGGAGWLGYLEDWEQTTNYSTDLIDDDVFWYLEPGVALEVNVTRNFRLNLGAGYRFTKDLELVNTSSTAFDGWNYFLTLKFGAF